MSVLRVENLSKKYPSFLLNNISFDLDTGKTTGFIGRNGAGKSTTIKSLLNIVHPDKGNIKFFDKKFSNDENNIKTQLGYVSSGSDFYQMKKIKTITATTKMFYPKWNDADYNKYCKMFYLDENKRVKDLSNGMKIKYQIALALSHGAKLLILDEPTSGLDPVSRDELLDLFLELNQQGVTIFFSTHITSDLEKCADNIIYISNGTIVSDCSVDDFENAYCILDKENVKNEFEHKNCGIRKSKNSSTYLFKKKDIPASLLPTEKANLEDIIIHLEKNVESDVKLK